MKRQNRGFTIIEALIGSALFIVVALSIYQGYISILNAVRLSSAKFLASNLANEQFEIVRNLPYSDVGIVNGIPSGKIPYQQTLIRDAYTFVVTSTIRNVDLPFDGTIGGIPNDLSPADNKLVELYITCTNCTNFTPLTFTTYIAPKNLETASTNGALFVQVFDANGVAIPDASVHVQSLSGVPSVDINDVTNANGVLQIVDIPPGVQRYKVTVSKSGFSTETTYEIGAPQNPNPVSPHITVVLQQVTQVSFAIDRTATLNISTVRDTCTPVADVDFNITGSKVIGTEPDVIKYSLDSQTNNNGLKTLGALEWDTYLLTLEDTAHDLIGLSLLTPFDVNPGATHDVQIIVAPKNPRSLMVTVKDLATSLPLSGASVTLEKSGYTETLITGRGFLTQSDWSGGNGQALFTDQDRYFDSDSNMEINNPAGILTLKEVFGSYVEDGWLISSTFNTGSPSNFYNLVWQPQDQPAPAGNESVRFQIATGNDQATTTWNFLGPDGTSNTYYTTSNANIDAIHSGHQYLRYKVLLHTEDTDLTPTIADVSFTFTSDCTPPGQVIFTGLSSGTYTLTVSKAGYQPVVMSNINMSSPWQQQEIELAP